jgi:hypothetical protein
MAQPTMRREKTSWTATRYSQPSQVLRYGDVGDPQPVGRRRQKRAVDEVLADPDAGHPDRRLAAPTRLQAGQAGRPHEPFHALAAQALAVGQDELGVDPRAAVDAAIYPVDLADLLEQPLVFDGPRRRAAGRPGVKARP